MRYNYYNTIYSIITHILLGFFLLEKLGPDAWNSVRVLYTWNGHLLVLFTTKQPYTDQGGCRKSHRRSFVITVFCSLTIMCGIIHLQTTGFFFYYTCKRCILKSLRLSVRISVQLSCSFPVHEC